MVKYYVCGVEVDKKTHDAMQERKFTFSNGDTRDFHTVEIWARSKEFEENLPGVNQEAKGFVEQVRSELRQAHKTQNNGSIRGYLDDLQTVYKGAFADREKLEQRYTDAIAAADAKRAMYGEEYHAKAVMEAGEERRKALTELEQTYTRGVDGVRKNLSGRLDEIFLATPDKLDTKTMALLESGVCTADELANLSQRHKANPVMQRVIASHAHKAAERMAERHGGKSGEYMKAYKVATALDRSVRTADDFLGAFDSLASWGRNVSGASFQMAKSFDTKWDEQFASHCETVDSADIYAG